MQSPPILWTIHFICGPRVGSTCSPLTTHSCGLRCAISRTEISVRCARQLTCQKAICWVEYEQILLYRHIPPYTFSTFYLQHLFFATFLLRGWGPYGVFITMLIHGFLIFVPVAILGRLTLFRLCLSLPPLSLWEGALTPGATWLLHGIPRLGRKVIQHVALSTWHPSLGPKVELAVAIGSASERDHDSHPPASVSACLLSASVSACLLIFLFNIVFSGFIYSTCTNPASYYLTRKQC